MELSGEKSGGTIEEVLKSYELYARAAGFSPSRIGQMRSCVGLFDQFLHGIKDIRKVTADDFRRFLANLRDRPAWQGLNNEKARHLSGTTITTYGRAVKTFFNWLFTEGIIADNILVSVKIPRNPKTLPKVYSEEELIVVFAAAAASIRDLAIFCLFLDSGIRLAELAGLQMGDIDTQNGTIKVRGKGNKERFACFGDDAAQCLDQYVKKFRQNGEKDTPLFLTEEGKPLQARGIQALLLRLGKKAGLEERLAPHKLRHTFATLSLKYGSNVEYIRKLLGHTDIKTTSNSYLNVPDADISAAHRRFSPLSNLRGTITEKSPASSEAAKPGFQPPPPSPTLPLYVETEHKRQMRELAEELIKGFRLPWIKDSFIIELKPGGLFLGKERFPISINEKGKIRLAPSIAGEEDMGLFHRALRTHLETAGLRKVLSDMFTWSDEVGDFLKKCHELLNKVRGEVEDTYHISIPVNDEGNTGVKMDFPILISADAIEQASGSNHYNYFLYSYEGSNLKFGAFIIFTGITTEDPKPFEDAHRKLRAKYATWPQTKVIAQRRRDINSIAITIIQQLQKFIAMENLPGQCELCS
jgi:integrase/recombinase XerC